MADLPAGAYRSGSIDYNTILDTDDLPIGYSVRGKDVYFPRTVTDSAGNAVGLVDPVGGVIKIVSATTNPLTGGVSFSAGGALANGDLIQCGVPLVLPSSGSIGNNGALTLTTALPYAYPAAFMYFPASAIVSGSAAGWYYVAMSTTLLGTIYNDVYVSGKPVVPSSPVTFSTTGPGAYTQTTGGAITSLNFTVPGGALGKSGELTITKMGACTNNANSKIVETFLGGSNFASYTFTTSNVYRALDTIANICNSEAINIGNFYANIGGNGADWKRQVVNTAADQTLALTMRINTATDFIVLESAAVRLVHGN